MQLILLDVMNELRIFAADKATWMCVEMTKGNNSIKKKLKIKAHAKMKIEIKTKKIMKKSWVRD